MGEPARADWNAELYGYTDQQAQLPVTTTELFSVDGKDMGETIAIFQAWANHQFPQQIIEPRRIISHLDKEERGELLDAFDEWEASDRKTRHQKVHKVAMEIADNLMLLFALCSALGIDVLESFQEKHHINLNREWADSGNGYDKHVEESR